MPLVTVIDISLHALRDIQMTVCWHRNRILEQYLRADIVGNRDLVLEGVDGTVLGKSDLASRLGKMKLGTCQQEGEDSVLCVAPAALRLGFVARGQLLWRMSLPRLLV
jgi:hypothetical protein